MSRRRTAAAAALLTISFLAGPAPAQAATPFTKLGRGVVNTGSGWLELPTCIGRSAREREGNA